MYAALEVNAIVSMAPPADDGGATPTATSAAAPNTAAAGGVDEAPAEEVDEEYDDDFEDADVDSPSNKAMPFSCIHAMILAAADQSNFPVPVSSYCVM